MDLEERIARLIDPEAWETVARGEAIGLTHGGPVFVNDSLIAARRVINGLGLTEQTRTMCDGLMPNGRDTYGDTVEHRLVTPWEPQEDA